MDRRRLETRYTEVANEAFTLRLLLRDRELELAVCRPQLYRANQRISRLKQQRDTLASENKALKARLADLSAELQQEKSKARQTPSWVKASVPAKKARKRPGRRKGHVAALRPMPRTVDVHQEVPLPVDESGKPSCPICHSQLLEVREYLRHVEELIPFKLLTTCYHTAGGYCPSCRKVVESRAPDQPPAADIPHGQFGLNALATAAVMRVCYRMPLRQITRLFAQLPGLKISPGGIVKQIKRLGRWLATQYHRLKLALRLAGVVYADETGWRVNGRNGQLWTLTNADHTLYHVDPSRGGKVIAELLGKAFGAEGQTLVSDFYGVYDQFDAPMQKCLAHVLRELRDLVAKRPQLRSHGFFKQCKRLLQDMLKLKANRKTFNKAAYAVRVARTEARLSTLCRCSWNDPDADRLTARLRKHEKSLTTFLHKPQVQGTNNAAERALRPAVVMRKITGGSRAKDSAQAWAILASVMR